MDIKAVKEEMRQTPPRCLRGFRLEPAIGPEADTFHSFTTAFRPFCMCGQDAGRVLGYALSALNPQYAGPETFVGPLAFACSRCEKITEIIDTAQHGYHSESGCGSAVYRGQSARSSYSCPKCRTNEFRTVFTFVYWDAAFDVKWDEPEIPLENYFNGFQAHGLCVKCGVLVFIAGFDT
jgi:hypothetical protein